MQTIPGRGEFATYRCLQFSKDRIVEKSWFRTFELSLFNGTNSLDVMSIDRESGSYDVIVCCHVIEHVSDHRRAVVELTRILSERGFLFLAYPAPNSRAVTSDWGFADRTKHGHYRVFGRDFELEYGSLLPKAFVAAIGGVDPATGESDRIYAIAKNVCWMERLLQSALGASIVAIPSGVKIILSRKGRVVKRDQS